MQRFNLAWLGKKLAMGEKNIRISRRDSDASTSTNLSVSQVKNVHMARESKLSNCPVGRIITVQNLSDRAVDVTIHVNA
jgi:hypothetical protein